MNHSKSDYLTKATKGQSINAGRIGERPCFQFFLHEQLKGVLVCSADYRQGEIYAEDCNAFGINNAKAIIHVGLENVLKAKDEKETNSIGFDFYSTLITLNEYLEIVKIHQDFDVSM